MSTHETDKNVFPDENQPNHVANVATQETDDFLGPDLENAISAADEAMQDALAIINKALTESGEDPGALATPAFNEAVRYVRENSAEEWARVRCRIKKEKPHGIRLDGIDTATRPPNDFDGPDSVASMQALPIPHPGGDIEELWEYCNIQEHDRPLVLAWILEAFRPETPFPVLAPNGPQGSAKSSTHNRIRQLIDPNKVNLRAAPKTTEDIYISAGVNWIVSFENISRLTPQQQDALCTLATGGGFASRTLYTNAEETIIEVKRPVIINSIPVVVTAQDLTDRVINVELKPIDYREESEINAAFEGAMPRIFGALLDLLVKTLAQLPKVKLTKPPRMADFTRLGEAMMQAQGHPSGSFEALFRANRQESVARAMESSPVAVAVRELVDVHQGQSEIVFHGTMKKLLETLAVHRHDTDGWPRSPRGLGDVLKRQSPALASIGIEIESGNQVQRIGDERGLPVKILKAGNVGNVGNVVSKILLPEKHYPPRLSGFNEGEI
ncbi:hypothetical protein [Methylosarcina fibrata]|uniref:hypothetical protein n=1 Tax=Methylosarcina fibrata TaxID=105972 RepID=UPI00037E6876|nr:hypothetical protein [Methylosarcina fibrata]